MRGYWSDRAEAEALLDPAAHEDLSPIDAWFRAKHRRDAARAARDRRRREADDRMRFWLNVILGESA